MSSMPILRGMSLAEYESLPVGPPHFEFENGEAVPVTWPTPERQDLVDFLVFLLKQFVRERTLGRVFREAGVYLSDGRVLIPDIIFVSEPRLATIFGRDRKIHGIPDLAVEIVSSNAGRDRVHKFQVYFANGIEWYWIADPDALTIEEYRADPDGYTLVASADRDQAFRSKLFPGLEINLGDSIQSAPEFTDPAAPQISSPAIDVTLTTTERMSKAMKVDPFHSEQSRIRSIVNCEFAASLMNNTKWRELANAMQGLPLNYRIKFVDVDYVQDLHGSWSATNSYYDSASFGPFLTHSIEWLEIETQAEITRGGLLVREYFDYVSDVELRLHAIGVDYHKSEDSILVVGHIRNG